MMDVSNAVDALGRQLPDKCWKSRLLLDVIVELGPPVGSKSPKLDIPRP